MTSTTGLRPAEAGLVEVKSQKLDIDKIKTYLDNVTRVYYRIFLPVRQIN